MMKERYSPASILIITLGGIVLAEVIAMIIVYNFRNWPYTQQVLFDAAIMVVIIYPLLYILTFKPLLAIIQQRKQSESILQSRLRLMQFSSEHTLDELFKFILDELETLTGSEVGFLHFLEDDQRTLRLQAWSTNTLQSMCRAEGKDRHYDIERAGVWADAVRQRKPIIHNDYATLPDRKGLPEGHAPIAREMVVPVLREHKVKAIVGVGNKPQDYTANDVEVITILTDFAWDIVNHKQAENALHESAVKFRTLVEWTYDWEKWLDAEGHIVYTSPSCERITGYTPEQFMSDPGLLVRIVHPDDRLFYQEHLNILHSKLADPATVEYRIISRDGREHWIEHNCRPLFGKDDEYLGRRISNREITERKQAEQKIIQHSQNEAMLSQTIRTIQADMARDLHDTLGQNIGYLRMNLDHLLEIQCSDPGLIVPQIQNMAKVANESYELVRAMLALLQPEYSTDPLSLFKRYAKQVADRSSINIDVTSYGETHQLSPYQIRQLFYIFREALTNLERYARANQALGEFIWENQTLTMVISDDGSGFDQNAVDAAGHFGLKFMSERADLLKASFSIQSIPGKGTKISVEMPYTPPEAH